MASQKMGTDGVALVPAVPVELVYAKRDDSAWQPFLVVQGVCDAVRSGEFPVFLLGASLGLQERN